MQRRNSEKNRASKVADLLSSKIITIDEAETLLDAIEFDNRLKDVKAWGTYYFPHIFSVNFCDELHDYLISIATEPKTATLAPRGHAKTTIFCFLIPLYLALNQKKFSHFLNIQSTSTKAKAINLAIRYELEQNEKLIKDYGEQMWPEKWTERQFVLKNGAVFSAIGTGESVRGINYRAKRPDYVIADDLYNDDCLENAEAVAKINRWWDGSIMYCTAIGKQTSIHIQGTAMHRDDLMHKKEKADGWLFKRFSAIKDFEKGIVLWPENKSFEELLKNKKDSGSMIFNREMQNEIQNEDDLIVRPSWLKFYDGRQILTKAEAIHKQKMSRSLDIDEHAVFIRAGIDPAEKTKEANDFTSKVGVIETNLGNYYVFDATNKKLSFKSNLDDIIAWALRFNLDSLDIETNKGEALYSEIRRTTNLPISGIHETRDKISRFKKQSAKFENGKVYISMLIPEAERLTLIEQLTTNNPTNDDMRDALILALEGERRGIFFAGSY